MRNYSVNTNKYSVKLSKYNVRNKISHGHKKQHSVEFGSGSVQ